MRTWSPSATAWSCGSSSIRTGPRRSRPLLDLVAARHGLIAGAAGGQALGGRQTGLLGRALRALCGRRDGVRGALTRARDRARDALLGVARRGTGVLGRLARGGVGDRLGRVLALRDRVALARAPAAGGHKAADDEHQHRSVDASHPVAPPVRGRREPTRLTPTSRKTMASAHPQPQPASIAPFGEASEKNWRLAGTRSAATNRSAMVPHSVPTSSQRAPASASRIMTTASPAMTSTPSATVRASLGESEKGPRASAYPPSTPPPIASPAGRLKRSTSARKRSGRHGPELGERARRKAGMPIVRVEPSVKWRGSSG